jgi:hypothetical protein
MSDAERWCVYFDRLGVVYAITPETQTNAERAARLCGDGHRAVPRWLGDALQNAFAHGRMHGKREPS